MENTNTPQNQTTATDLHMQVSHWDGSPCHHFDNEAGDAVINKGDVVIGDSPTRKGVRGVVKIVETRGVWVDEVDGDPLVWVPLWRETVRVIPAAAGGSNELDVKPAGNISRAAELLVLDHYNELRALEGHDYGAGQRGNELRRRKNELGGDLTYVLVEGEAVRLNGVTIRPGSLELAAAARRLLAPRLRRVEREDFRDHTPATRRTRAALEAALWRFETAAAADLPPVAGGTNELDEVIVELRGKVELERRRELADAERIGAEARRTGSYIAGEAASSCARRAEGLGLVLRDAGHKAATGSPRVAVLLLKGTLGDKVAAKAARTYPDDAALEAAEALSAAQDYSDGGGPVDETGGRLFD